MTDTPNSSPEHTERPQRRRRRGSDGKSKMRSASAVLARMLVTVALLAILVIGIVNVIGARRIFSATVDSQLASLAEDRAQTVARELERVRSEVAVIARDLSVAAATREIFAGYEDLTGDSAALTDVQQQKITDFYVSTPELADAPDPASLVPTSDPARYLQYYYVVTNPNGADDRAALDDAGDGSTYSEAHARNHPMLSARADLIGAGDLMLITLGDEPVIAYSTNKRLDFGTSLRSGPYLDTSLAKAIANRLSAVPAGDAVLVDFEQYLPAGTSPTMFAVASIRDKTEVVGAVAVALPDGFIDSITTFDDDWASVRVGESGEVYLVGPDLLMRSVSRQWVEDPDGYLKSLESEGYPSEVIEAVRKAGTTVLAQPVDTEAVSVAYEGTAFAGADRNYLGERTTAYANQISADGVDWVVVSAFAVSEATAPLWRYIISLGILALIAVPIVAVVSVAFARRLTRPVKPLKEAAERIAGGDIESSVPFLGRNEYGDLGNRINALTAEIRARDAQREEQEREISKVLLAALPPRLVGDVREAIRDGSISDAADFTYLSDSGTVIAVSVHGYFDLAASDMEATVETSTEFARSVEKLAEEFGIERVRATPEDQLFTAGLNADGIATDDAMRFVDRMLELLGDLQEETARTGEFRIGVAAGWIDTGLIRGTEFTFDIWGDPVRKAMSFSRIAGPYEVLVDRAVTEEIGDSRQFRPVRIADLQGDEIDAFVLEHDVR